MRFGMFGTTLGLLAIAGTLSATAATLPTAKEIQANMGMGFNIGNSMEVPDDPTGWGNPYPTQALLDSVKAAGFNTVRTATHRTARLPRPGLTP